MKRFKFFLPAFVIMLCCYSAAHAQVTLPEVVFKMVAANYKYLKSAGDTNAAQPVNMLQKMAATYDIKNSDFYVDEYDNYFVSFYIPDGEILAAYDQDGKMLYTVEKYKNVALPKEVRDAVVNRFPQWAIAKDSYLVNYTESAGSKKVYKLTLQNGDKRLRVKTDEKGAFL